MRWTVGALALGLALAGAGAAHGQSDTAGRTTLDSRVVPAGEGGYVELGIGAGSPLVVRDDLTTPDPRRGKRRRSLLYFAQLSDFQLTDEESPTRVEFLDRANATFSSAFRPHEALLPHTVDASIRQVNLHRRSPFRLRGGRRANLALSILTGDNADNQQENEAVWVDTLLDGGRLDPGSGRADAEALKGQGCPPASAALEAEAPRYTGVQDFEDAGGSGTFWDPQQPGGLYETFPTYPGLMDRAQQPFMTGGLIVPSYVALGNHDGLVQGNQAASSETNAIATGCQKPLKAPALDDADPFASFVGSLTAPSGSGSMIVPPDPARRQVTRKQYRELFANGGQADAHGFSMVDAKELEASGGAASYYDFTPRAGLRFIALDTIVTGGIAGPGASGNIDDPQFEWLRRKLEAAEAADELVIVFSHHGPTSLEGDVPDEVAGSCDDPEEPSDPGCDADPRSSEPLHLTDDMVALLLEFPHVIAWVAGHSHVNDVAFHRAEGGSGFWVVRTSAEADFPHQDRLIDLMDNRDGTLSLLSAVIDNAAPSAAPPSGAAAEAFTTEQLASIARTVGYNDPDRDEGAEGEASDRNVELLVRDPRRARPARAKGRRVLVRPKRVVAGRRTTLRIRVVRSGKPVRRALVKVAGKRKRANARGRARVRVKLRRTGIRKVRSGGASTSFVVVRR